MKSLSETAGKLLMALNRSGIPVSLEQKRFWSRKYEKMMTKYTVKRADKATGKKEKLLESYSMSEVVKLLAALWKECGETDCRVADAPRNDRKGEERCRR